MRADDAPALRHARPGLALAPLTVRVELQEFAVCRREILAIGRDHGPQQAAAEIQRRPAFAEREDLVPAVKILSQPVADCQRIVPETLVEAFESFLFSALS